jgi:hypothetical protein
VNFHPFSEVFPLLEGAPFEELADDIKAHGLREKIWLYDGKILDGRNRFLACRKARVAPAYRKYTGKDPIAFVVSVNIQRRHLTESQRAMAAARIATLRHGQRADLIQEVPIGTSAATLNVGVRSVKRARKVIEEGSKDLQQAVDHGEVSVSKAAAVVDLPKREQLAAAQASPVLDEHWEPDADEEAAHAAMEKEYDATIEKVMGASDPLAKAHDEIKRLTALVGVLTSSRDQFQNGHGEVVRLLKKEQRKVQRLEHELDRLRAKGFG